MSWTRLSVDWKTLHARGQAVPILRALRAMNEGVATPEQQRDAMAAIQYVFLGRDDLCLDPDPRLSTALEGRRSAALQIERAIKQPMWKLVGDPDPDAPKDPVKKKGDTP